MTHYKFRAEMNPGFVFKGLVDELAANITANAHFQLEEHGISSCNSDNLKTVLIKSYFPRSNFIEYICEEEFHIAVNIKQLSRVMKTVKRKDKLAIFIDSSTPMMLGITTVPVNDSGDGQQKKNTTRVVYISVSKQDMVVDGGYKYPKVIKSVEFQKMCKQMQPMGKKLIVTIQGSTFVMFKIDGGDMFQSDISFGQYNSEVESYSTIFDMGKISQQIKLCSLTGQIQIFAPGTLNYPLKFKVDTLLGAVEAYIKDRDQIQLERNESKSRVKVQWKDPK